MSNQKSGSSDAKACNLSHARGGTTRGFAALLVVCVGLYPIGALLRRQNTLPEINLIAGWSTASLISLR